MKCPACQRDIVAPVGFHWECDSCGWVGPNLDLRNSVRREHRPAYVRPNDVSDRRYAFVACLDFDPPQYSAARVREAAPKSNKFSLHAFVAMSAEAWATAGKIAYVTLQRIARETR